MSYWETDLRKFEAESDAAIYNAPLEIEVAKAFMRTLHEIRNLPEPEAR